MRYFELVKDTLGMKTGQTFMQTADGMYINAANTCRLNAVMVENNKQDFKEVEPPNIWKPTQVNEAFWFITPDGGVVEMGWDETKFLRLWQFGNIFRDKEHADEVAQAITVMIRTYQKKFSDYITKHPKDSQVLQQAIAQAPPPLQQVPTPPVVPQEQPPQPPQQAPQSNVLNSPQYSPFNRFTNPGEYR